MQFIFALLVVRTPRNKVPPSCFLDQSRGETNDSYITPSPFHFDRKNRIDTPAALLYDHLTINHTGGQIR